MSIAACPNCGARLSWVVADWQSAPWVCRDCVRGWWAAELAPDAQLAWDPPTHDQGPQVGREVGRSIKEEVAAAHERGVCVREDMLSLLDKAALQSLVDLWGQRLGPAFLARVEQALKAA